MRFRSQTHIFLMCVHKAEEEGDDDEKKMDVGDDDDDDLLECEVHLKLKLHNNISDFWSTNLLFLLSYVCQ